MTLLHQTPSAAALGGGASRPDMSVYESGMERGLLIAIDSSTRPLHDLCFGASGFDVTPYLDRQPAQAASIGAYGDPSGDESLRIAIAEFVSERAGRTISPSRIFVTTGATQALLCALAVVAQPGQEVIVAETAYPPYRGLLSFRGAIMRRAPIGAFDPFDLEETRARITPRTASIIVTQPSNPTGAALSRQQLEALASLGVPLISDEVYFETAIGERPPSLLSCSDDHFVLDSFSKSFAAPGIRLGFLVVPERHVETIHHVKCSLTIATSLVAQDLGRQLMAARHRLLPAHRDYLAGAARFFRENAEKHGIKLLRDLTATFYAMVGIPAGSSSRELSERMAREVAVVVAPGFDFCDRDPEFFRINFAASPDAIRDGLTRIAPYLRS